MTELTKMLSELSKLDIIKITLSDPRKKDAADVLKCTVKPVVLKNKRMFQFESFTQKQAFHKNAAPEEICAELETLLTDTFRQAQIFTPEYIYGLKITSKGKLLHNRTANTAKVKLQGTDGNNRAKNYIIDIENAPPVLHELGIISNDGKIVSSKYDKFRQICRFAEIINDAVSGDIRECFNIVDFGCGKSYLTFVVYHYITEILGAKAKITGLDLKSDVIENCNKLSEKYGISDDVKFLCMDVKDYIPDDKVDMVIALHACDIATDYALFNAYLWQADYIFSAPCCQHEMNSVMKTQNFSLLSDYGLLKERFCALSTDALRCKILTFLGYKTDILEFVDAEISPKNLLIRAVRTTKITREKRELIRTQIKTFDNEFTSPLSLERMSDEKYKSVTGKNSDKTLFLETGKASMLIKDAMTVRKTVFGKEQNYVYGSSRDKDDETAWIANIYDGDKTVSTSRMIFTENKNARLLGKIAVLPEYRSEGLGKIMLTELIRTAKSENVRMLYVNAQTHAVPFYKKLGFEICGNEYAEENIPMVKMRLVLP